MGQTELTFFRLHTPLKNVRYKCGIGRYDNLPPREQYLYNRSHQRWERRDDGMNAIGFAKKAMLAGEIGRYEGVRFIVSDT